MSRFEMTAGLDTLVAAKIVRPYVDHLTVRVETEAKRGAPDAKTWLTRRDEKVRPSHVYADGQEVPSNLRYKIPKVNTGNDANDIRAGFDLARRPGDPDLPIGNRIHCRCESVVLPNELARHIERSPTTVAGTSVKASVRCTFPRAAESEYGTDEDVGTHFMHHALEVVAVETRQREVSQ
jgi:hypothetical protein